MTISEFVETWKRWCVEEARDDLETDVRTLIMAERQRWAKQVDEAAQEDIEKGNPVEGAHYRALKRIGGL